MGIYFNPDPGQSVELPSMEAVRILRRQQLATTHYIVDAASIPEAAQAQTTRSLRMFVQQSAANFPSEISQFR